MQERTLLTSWEAVLIGPGQAVAEAQVVHHIQGLKLTALWKVEGPLLPLAAKASVR